MAEQETTDAPADTEDAPVDAPDESSTEEPDASPNPDADKWKALARKHEREAKDRLAKLKEYEDRDKTEAERISERLAAAEQRALDADRLEIALEKGLTKGQAKRLVGSTREELEADADELLADLGVDDDKPSTNRRPKERLRPGASNDAEPQKSPQELAAEVVKARGY